MIIEVAGNPDESCISISKVSDYDMEILEPLLLDIKSHCGYYPTGKFKKMGKPSARELYHNYVGWDVFESLVPKPISGFSSIIKVSLFKDEPYKMEML